MPARTPFPPHHAGEAQFWGALLRLDDGRMHLWHGVTPSKGTEIDVLLFDLESGAYCIEVKALGFSGIRHLDLQTLERLDGSVGPSPFQQALYAARCLGGALDRCWEDRLFLVPVAAFPQITREEWAAKFTDGPLSRIGCLLADDLRDLATFRARLDEVANTPLMGRARRRENQRLEDQDPDRLHTILFGSSLSEVSTALVTVAEPDDSRVPGLLLQTIELVRGPGSALGSPGLDALTKWSNALSETSDRLRVSVVGDFKAGKSSLINAILKREVCYVDEFEATGVRAAYRDGAPESAELTMESGESVSLSVAEFLQRCARRETQAIKSATVTLSTGLPFDIADSPGLGSLTCAHVNQAEEEIRRTDMLLFAVDCADPGGARESSLIARAREIGLPVLVLLTKADMLGPGEDALLTQYIVDETQTPASDVIAVSAHSYAVGSDAGVEKLLERLIRSSQLHREHRRAALDAKYREIASAATVVLKNLIEINAPYSRFVTAERGYLETSAQDISQAAKAEWLLLLRDECARVVGSPEIQQAVSAARAESALREAIPSAIDRASASFMQRLHVLVRSEWRQALEERSHDFERRIADMLRSRPDAAADLEFLQHEQEAFSRRAQVVTAQSDDFAREQRLWLTGMGAAASIIVASFLPLALGAVAAAFVIREQRPAMVVSANLDPSLNARLEDHLVSAFDKIGPSIEQSIDRIVSEVAIRSLDQLVRERGGPDLQTILTIERRANDLLD